MVTWADEVVVIEAGERSGALMTGELSLKNNKKVYAVPHNLFLPSGQGCNLLLEKGAIPFLGNGSVLGNRPNQVKAVTESSTRDIVMLLQGEPKTAELLSAELKRSLEELQKELFSLELSDLVEYRPDGKWHYIGW